MFLDGFQANVMTELRELLKFPGLWRGKKGLGKTPVLQTVSGEYVAACSVHKKVES